MAFKGLDGVFGIISSVDVGRGKFESVTIAADGGFELASCLVVENMPIDMNDLGVASVLIYGLVGFDEIIGFV